MVGIRGAISATTSTLFGITIGVQYWLRVIHDPTFGSFGKITVEIYTGGLDVTLVGTISLALNAAIDFRYFYPFSAFTDGITQAVSGFCEEWNLTAGEVVSGRRRRMLAGRP